MAGYSAPASPPIDWSPESLRSVDRRQLVAQWRNEGPAVRVAEVVMGLSRTYRKSASEVMDADDWVAVAFVAAELLAIRPAETAAYLDALPEAQGADIGWVLRKFGIETVLDEMRQPELRDAVMRLDGEVDELPEATEISRNVVATPATAEWAGF